MSKDEFMYDHDLNSLTDLLNRHAEFHGVVEEQEEKPSVSVTENPREFFL